MSLKDTIYDTLHFHKGTQFSMNVVVVVVFAISEGQSLKKEFAELQIRLYCVEDMSLEPTASIPAFVSNIPIFKGLGLGMMSKNSEYSRPIFVDAKI